ncbi:Galactose-1-phosphate uridylyltransferase [sediment metagenome]|uniref:Galactose-1-phosphate uridylyltransferase n=1 Tax=sediment metagenome TaxID=749907 RepID=D9PNL8_9ZZZZ
MAKYVPDVSTQRWVIISPTRLDRPQNTDSPAFDGCPFCPGSESHTPPEVYRIGPGEKDKPGWMVRVVPNKYSITDIHEVIIHSPDDKKDIESLDPKQVERIVFTYRERYRAHEAEGHVLIFCNHGVIAGASLSHPHSQLVVVPRQINFDAVLREPIMHVVEDSQFYTAYCPDFSQWPYEVWIAPKTTDKKFGDATDAEVSALAMILQRTIKRIEKLSATPSFPFFHPDRPFEYNYYISHTTNWFLRIIPRYISRAGFELGTGVNVNVVNPQGAAEELRKVQG